MARRRFVSAATLVVLGCSSTAPSEPPADAGVVSQPATSNPHARTAVATLRRFETLAWNANALVEAREDGWTTKGGAITATVPKKADLPLRLEDPKIPSAWIEIVSEDVRSVGGVLEDGAVVFADAAEATDVVQVLERGRVEELRLFRDATARVTARYALRVGPKIASVRVRQGRIEAVDATGYVRLGTAPIFAVDANGQRRDARVTVSETLGVYHASVEIDVSGLAYPIALDPAWTTVASMTHPRESASATMVITGGDSQVVVVGGLDAAAESTAEIYRTANNTWEILNLGAVFGALPTVVTLANGTVLVTGGLKAPVGDTPSSGRTQVLACCTGNVWTSTRAGDLQSRRAQGVAVAHGGGAYLFGGSNANGINNFVDFFDPAGGTAGTWSYRPAMVYVRKRAFGAVTPDGSAIVVGGGEDSTGAVNTSEVYSPNGPTGTWTNPGNLPARRAGAMAFTVQAAAPGAAAIVVVGGADQTGAALQSTLKFVGGAWYEGAILPGSGDVVATAPLVDQNFLVLRGTSRVVLDTATNQTYAVPSSTVPRYANFIAAPVGGAGVPLAKGHVLVAGGIDTVKTSAELYAFAPLGTACTSSAPCAAGLCVDGVCCESTCAGGCEYCGGVSGTASPGRCAMLTNVAPMKAGATCGAYSKCQNGVCASSCALNADCAATHYCPLPGNGCAPKQDLGGVCGTSAGCLANRACVDSICCDTATCPTGSSCNHASSLGTCKRNLGESCTAGSECGSTFCVDSVCCATACTGACMACSTAKKGSGADGTCAAIAADTDPDNECTAQSCTGATLINASLCSGTGACVSKGTTPCATGYVCEGSRCASACTTDASCAGTHYCNTATNQCVAKVTAGGSCTVGAQCATGFCADGVCCNEACGGCKACTAALKGSGSDGTCGNIAADSDPHNACAQDAQYPTSCGSDGMCDGNGVCRTYAKASTACGTTTCAAGKIVGKICNGAGQCNDNPGTDCAPYACDGTTCATSCIDETKCGTGAYCTTASTCGTKKASGATCANGKECGSGFCTDGVCCDTACEGQCQACDVAGKVGSCSAVAGAPHGARAKCAGQGTPCAGACEASNPNACTYPGATTACGSSCAAGTETKKLCDAKGACVDGGTSRCLPYVCADDGKTCAVACTGDMQCLGGYKCANNECVLAAGNTCKADLSATIDSTGKETSCGAYRCDAQSGTCHKICTSSDECSVGNACDSTTKACAPAQAPATEDGGGCTYGRSSSPSPLFGLLALGLMRRRRAKPSNLRL